MLFTTVGRSPIDENNDSVSEIWNVYRHGIVAKLTSAAVFTAAEDLAKIIICTGHVTKKLSPHRQLNYADYLVPINVR